MATGLALLLFLSLLSGCTARHMPDDWSRVQAVPRETRTIVRLYKDKAPRGSRKIRGRFHSAAADSITLDLKDGQMRTLEKQDVRKVRIHRPYLHRWPGWAALGVGGLILAALGTDGPPNIIAVSPSHDHSSGDGCIFFWLRNERDLPASPAARFPAGPSSRKAGKSVVAPATTLSALTTIRVPV